MASSILQKNEQNSLSSASSLIRIVSFIHFYRRIEDTIIFFRDLLTFTNNWLFNYTIISYSPHFSLEIFLQIIHFSVENSTAVAVIVEASLSCSIFMMRQKILYRKEVCPLRYIKVSTDQQYTMYLKSWGVNISFQSHCFWFKTLWIFTVKSRAEARLV